MLRVKLSDIIHKFDASLSLTGEDCAISSVEYDSRKAGPGSLFVAVEGFSVDGHDFIQKALESGAAAVVVSAKRKKDFDLPVPVIAAADTRAALSYISSFVYGDVSSKIPVIGVTGTNGKTSITYMIESILNNAGFNTGVMGTVTYRWNNISIEAPNTTPESRDIHEMLYRMHNEGVNVIVMEVSSHGLALDRVDDLKFTGALFTNLTQDHLDFHKTFEEYYQAKKKLFTLINSSPMKNRFAVINTDDEYGKRLITELKMHASYKLVSCGTAPDADFHPEPDSVKLSIAGSSYDMIAPDGISHVDVNIGGKFSLYNSIVTFAAAHLLGVGSKKISEGLAKLKTVPGRFDRVDSPEGFHVIVDYAHTSDAMEKLLASVCDVKHNRVITVFGCGGDRDKGKRPLMAQAALKYSDYVYITSDNPRTEDPDAIIADILTGASGYEGKFEKDSDRERSIAKAVRSAVKGDIIVIAGKGHENYQIIGETKHHFDDKEIAAKYISERTTS